MPKNQQIFDKLSKITYDRCKTTCKSLGSCCSNEYCEIAEEYAQSKGTSLKSTSSKIKFLTSEGICIVPPEFRPFCTLHQCEIADLGYFKGNEKLTQQYFKLRESIKEL